MKELTEYLGMRDRVDFVDFLPDHADVLQEMAQADLFLFPSVREGFGMVALEALALGTPVVTSDHPDNFARYLVRPGENGTVCAPTAEAFADAIENCLRRLPQLNAGAVGTAEEFEWDSVADRARLAYAV